MKTTTKMPDLTGPRKRFSRGSLQQACMAALARAREEQQTAHVGSNYLGYYVTYSERDARGTSNIWYEVERTGQVTRVEDLPKERASDLIDDGEGLRARGGRVYFG
jgi:hypothetical protein